MMASAVPKVLILGHSFVKRLQSDLNTTFDARADSNFRLEGTATVHLLGVSGRTVEKLRRCVLHVVRRLAPDVVILEVGRRTGGCWFIHRGACQFAFRRFFGECGR